MEEVLLEVGHQAVDVHQQEALEVAVDVLQSEAQEVDVHQLEVLEVVLEVQEVAQELVGAHTSTHPLMPTIKLWQKLPRLSQVPQPPAWRAVQDAPATAGTTLATLTTARLSPAAQEV